MSATLEAPAAQSPPYEEIKLDVSHLVTEDDTPVDNPFCEKQMRLLTHPLYASWKPGKPFTAMANVGLYSALNAPPLVPDTLVSLGVEPPSDLMLKQHRAYFTWIYGKPPDIVIEIVSNTEGGELDRKMRAYAFQRVPFYVVFDPENFIQEKRLRFFALRGAGFEPRYREFEGGQFEDTGLGLVEWEGEFEGRQTLWIRWVDDKGQLIPTGEERADDESRRAEDASRRAEALAAKLREMGVDPSRIP